MLSGLRMSTVWENQKAFNYIPTGSNNLDAILEGGIRTAAMTEVYGKSGCGKTQFAIELMLNTIFSSVNGHVIYVSTKKSLSPDNIKRKINRYIEAMSNDSSREPLTLQNALRRIQHKRPLSLNEFIYTIYHVRETVDQAFLHQPIKLVIIDSFTDLLRNQPPWDRIRVSHELAAVLDNTAVQFVSFY